MKRLESKKTWSKEEAKQFYEDLLARALQVIPESGRAMIAGPMFIVRSPEENFARFEQARKDLEKKGVAVFDQLPFVDYNMKEAPFDYPIKFNVFYKGLIGSGKITSCYLLPDWQKSEGTRTEIQYSKEAGIPIYEL